MSEYDAALATAAHGWYVFPVDHPDLPQCAGPKTAEHNPATCDKRGKHPAIKWDSGASTSVENITYWWSGNPRNVGIHCGKSGLLVIDEDEPGEFARFAADHGVEIPDTFTVQTAAGRHYYFADTEAGALGNKEGAFGSYAINVRSGNGYVIGHGSKHASGVTYTANGVRDVAPLPSWVIESIRGKQLSGSDHSESRERFELPDVIKEGHRDEVLYRYACSLRSYDLPFNTALVLMKDAWNRCEQPPVAGSMYEWATAIEKLKAAYDRHDGGRSEEYRNDAEPDDQSGLTLAEKLLPRELGFQRARRKARDILDAETRGVIELPPIIRLDEFLATPDEETTYLIDDIWPSHGKILFAAQHKAGKTTARDNVVRSLADGVPFLGKYQVQPITNGPIVVIDNEMDDRMMRRWLRAHGIKHQDRIAVLPMLGRVSTFDLLNPEIRSRWVALLRPMEPAVVVLDCLRPVLDALGLSEDKDAGRFLVAFDELLWETGVDHAMVVHHMGHVGERSRGDSRLIDWPTAIWKLVKKDPDDPQAARWFSAYGRDAFAAESLLAYDRSTRHLEIAGGSRKDAEAEAAWPLIEKFLIENPDCSGNAIEKEMKEKHDIGWSVVRRSIELAVERKEMEVEVTAKGKPNPHRLINKEAGSQPRGTSRSEPANPTSQPRNLAYRARSSVEVVEELPIDQSPRTLFDLLTGGEWPICQRCGKPINVCRGVDHRMLFVLRAS